MTQDTRQEIESMLRHSSERIVNTSHLKANHEKDNNNINNNNNNNSKSATIRQYASNFRGVFAQCLVTGAVLLLTAGCGMPIGYSAVLLPQLEAINGTLHADLELGTWIASVHSLATPFGSLLSGPLLDAIGRRGSLQISAIPMCVGWIVMGSATSIPYILTGRILSGFAVGLVAVPAQVFIGEISDPGLRGILVGSPFAAYSFGILLVFALGATLTWDKVAYLGVILPGLSLLTLSLSPESPVWLVRRRRTEAAKKALLWFRGGDTIQVNTEMALLESRARADIARMSSTASLSQQASSAMSNILNPGVLKPLAIINVFNFLQILSGTYLLVFYAVDFINAVGGSTLDKYLVAVITAVVRFVFCVVSCILLLKMGRRMLGIISAMGTAVASLVLAGYMLARPGELKTVTDTYIACICILIYVAANTVGLMALPGLMVSELLPQRARGLGGGCTFFLFNLTLFGFTKLFRTVIHGIGITGVFTVFGASSLLEAVFIYVAVPETKGRSLQQIEDYFKEGNMLWVTRKKEQKIIRASIPSAV